MLISGCLWKSTTGQYNLVLKIFELCCFFQLTKVLSFESTGEHQAFKFCFNKQDENKWITKDFCNHLREEVKLRAFYSHQNCIQGSLLGKLATKWLVILPQDQGAHHWGNICNIMGYNPMMQVLIWPYSVRKELGWTLLLFFFIIIINENK